LAKSRNKEHLLNRLTSSERYNYHKIENAFYATPTVDLQNDFQRYQQNFYTELNAIMPPRRKWIKLGQDVRIHSKTNQPISSNDRYYNSLIKTISKYRKQSPKDRWVINLEIFINEIQNSLTDQTYHFSKPIVYPKLKGKLSKISKNPCRPISLFPLKERIILSLTNNFFTTLFDPYFEDCSYAFRLKKYRDTGRTLTHHDCIKEIQKYRKANRTGSLWAVECDMEKFYDSVNHTIIEKLFIDLLDRVRKDNPEIELSVPYHFFKEFLNCYAFNKDVPSKYDKDYWNSYRIPNGEFEWVEKKLVHFGYYTDVTSERIGVPQGGALSGLIANIVLNKVDKEVLETDVFYVRFCDDMIILATELQECNRAKNRYISALKDQKLVPHDFKDIYNQQSESILQKCLKVLSFKSLYLFPHGSSYIIRRSESKRNPENKFGKFLQQFWHEKSKGPYRWRPYSEYGFPWIGFVGYEIDYLGNIRVRKRSLLKEQTKQKQVIQEITRAIHSRRRKNIGTIAESAIHRLVGMSVGRVSLRNYDTVESELCWESGFHELKLNKYSGLQMKQLDRNRNKLYYYFLDVLKDREAKEGKIPIKTKLRKIVHFDKPFSYYFQILERKQIDESKQ
jgi:hypothetical protein